MNNATLKQIVEYLDLIDNKQSILKKKKFGINTMQVTAGRGTYGIVDEMHDTPLIDYPVTILPPRDYSLRR
tara:strand:+ start:579 stop:791 length:213 start_codon:yes stop_codon:yes gene_type:complete